MVIVAVLAYEFPVPNGVGTGIIDPVYKPKIGVSSELKEASVER